MQATATDEQIKNFKLEAGDVLITKDSETFDDIAIPAFVPKTLQNVICGYHLAHIKPLFIDGKYLFYAFQATNLVSQFHVSATGITRYGIGKNDIGNSLFILPKIAEQKRIAEFLDRKCGEIDEAIAKKQRLIELLEEQKTILINQAVTKGLNPDAPMKDSGIEWLGEIPAHWKLLKFKYCCSVIKDGLHITPQKHEQGIFFISTQHIRNRYIDLSKATYISEKDYLLGHPRIKPEIGDVLITLVGSIGFAALVKQKHLPLSFTRHVGYVRCKSRELNQTYLINYTESNIFQCFVENNVSRTAQPSIYLNSLSDHYFPLPPLIEQIEINDYIDHKLHSIYKVKTNIISEIEKLTELKQILIAEAVTGKIKV